MMDFADLQRLQLLAAVICVPIWGALIDQRILSERALLAWSSVGWGISSILLATTVDSVSQFLLLKTINMGFLCGKLPIGQAIVVKVAPPRIHGVCFCFIAVVGAVGALIGTTVGTDISEREIHGMMGWRFGLLQLGMSSILFAIILFFCVGSVESNDEVDTIDRSRPFGTAYDSLR